MYDVLIRRGTVIDGTGQPGVVVDIAIANGRIAAIGDLPEVQTTHDVDANGLTVCPGFIDPHTHYDAQLLWDPMASPSNLHGVTSVVMGNCGFTLAPLADKSDATYLEAMMVQVEGMSPEALKAGVDWDWRSFGDYLNRLDNNIGVNAAVMVGHCALRRMVMKDESVTREATAPELEEMKRILGEALSDGGFGFSTTRSFTHTDGNGSPVPSRMASTDELLALAEICKEHSGTTLEWVSDGCLNGFSEDEVDLMAAMSLAAGRSINWNVLTVDSARPDDYQNQLAACERVAERGGRAVALTMPILVGMTMHFHSFCALYKLPDWEAVMTLPIAEKKVRLADPEVRRFLEGRAASSEAGVFSRLTGWDRYLIGETYSDENLGLEGRLVGDIAQERGRGSFDTLLDIVLSDDLQTVLWPEPTDDDPASWQMRQTAWKHEGVMIGGSDAGAHLDRMAGASYPTEWLADCLRGRGLASLEEAISHMTDVPARYFGLVERGRISEGYCADLVIFDSEKIGSTDLRRRHDLPGKGPRLYATAEGIHKVFVNGVLTVENGSSTGALPGIILRSGIHSATVSIPLTI